MSNLNNLTCDELARELGVQPSTVRKATCDGLPCRRVGRLVRYSLDAAQQWFQERGEKSLALFRATRAATKARAVAGGEQQVGA